MFAIVALTEEPVVVEVLVVVVVVLVVVVVVVPPLLLPDAYKATASKITLGLKKPSPELPEITLMVIVLVPETRVPDGMLTVYIMLFPLQVPRVTPRLLRFVGAPGAGPVYGQGALRFRLMSGGHKRTQLLTVT